MSGDEHGHDEIVQRDERSEARARDEVKVAAAHLARVAGPVWHWGDGNGGWVIDQVYDALYATGVLEHPPAGMDPRNPKARIPATVRKAVMERDAYRCQICDTWFDLTLDHIVPESHGGPATVDNLRVLCRSCNSRRGAARLTDEELS